MKEKANSSGVGQNQDPAAGQASVVVPPEIPPAAVKPAGAEFSKRKVGNLYYTRSGLGILFFWLIIFDFIFVLAENHVAPVLQVHLKRLGISNTLFSTFLVMIPSIMNFFMNPLVGIKSDRHRGPRGRRIPFLIYSTPFVCVFMAILGFGNEIAAFLHAHFFPSSEYNTVAIWTFLFGFTVFSLANLFPNILFGYLFNDVVPKGHIVKFMSLLRIPGLVAGMVFNFFFFGFTNKTAPLNIDLGFFQYHSEAFWYPKFILIGLAIFFAIFFPIACLMIKEPNYPPPPPLAEGQRLSHRLKSTLKTLATECFSHKFYVMFFITMSMDAVATILGSYQTPMLDSMGVNFDYLGKIQTATGFISGILLLLTAGFGDRWRPLSVMVVGWVLTVVTAPTGLLFLIPGLSPDTYMWIRALYAVVHIPVNLTLGLAGGALAMSLLPRERFGQFCAANAMLRVILAQVVGLILGTLFLNLMEWLYANMKWIPAEPQYYLRYCFVWQMFFQIIVLICFVILFRMWKKLGGKTGYVPPPVGKVKTAEASV